MLPSLSFNDVMNGASSETKLETYLVVRETSGSPDFSDFQNIGCSSLGIPATLPAAHSSFFNSVLNIISMSPKKQMIRVNTWGIVAFVTNAHAFRDRSFMNFPRKPVHPYVIGSPAHMRNRSVTRINYISSPEPARISFFNVIPKPCLGWNSLDVGFGIFCRALPRAESNFIGLEMKTTDGTFDLHSKKFTLSYCDRGSQNHSAYPEFPPHYQPIHPCKP